MEKSLPLPVEQQARPAAKSSFRRYFTSFVIVAVTLYWTLPIIESLLSRSHHPLSKHHGSTKASCSQPDPLFPSNDDNALKEMYDLLSTEEFKKASIARHSGAVKFPTESFDDLGPVGEDKRWDTRFALHDYLADIFPRIHKSLKMEKVNTFGLVYTWQGSDDTLKPLILMAHQDVVPVPEETVDAWTHPPFSGYYDGKYIWGRGSSDCKNQLIAEMEAIELFLEAGFEPKRTIILSLGFDEEISGGQGAGHLAPFLHERYGDDGIAAIVDEGAGISKAWYVGTQYGGLGKG